MSTTKDYAQCLVSYGDFGQISQLEHNYLGKAEFVNCDEERNGQDQ